MSSPVAEGDVVLDKYRVERVLGKGGMGVVVAATHVELEQRVALKFLLPAALEHPEIVERFAREARAAAKIQSQHVARVIDTGRMPSGAPFMVMEYLEGLDLAAVLERDGQLSSAVAVDYVLQACEAIAEAHAAGIVHRDLKPSNLFLAKQRDRRAIIKVLDFGISKLDEPNTAPLTRTATMMGSPQYMSPEQLTSSKDVDARTDIWSLGVILYELVAGRRPFDGQSLPEIVALILQNTPARLSVFRPEVSLEFERVVSRCLTTFTQDRFGSVADLASALRPFAPDGASAQVSIARITRVLGGASLPPGSPEGPNPSLRVVATAETLAAHDGPETRIVSANVPSFPSDPASSKAVVASGVVARPNDARTDAVSVVTPPERSARSPLLAYAVLGGALLVGGAIYATSRGREAAAPVALDRSAGSAPPVTSPVPEASAAPSLSASAAASVAEAMPSAAAASSTRPVTPKPRSTSTSTAKTAAVASTAPAAPVPPVPPAPKKSPLDMGIK